MQFPEIVFDQRVSEAHQAAVEEYIARFPDTGPPPILSLEHFSVLCGLEVETLFGMSNSPHAYYRSFHIKKSNGGIRRIDAPLPTALLAQRWILSNILEKNPCHAAAKAYIKGKSIRSNARFHRGQKYVLKVDVINFFGEIKEFHIYRIFREFGYCKAVAVGLSKICCLRGCLPQGAPTSGYLSNLLLFDFDDELLKFAQERKLRYSRYADDIAISGENIEVAEVISKINALLDPISLRINFAKTKLIPQSNRQKITGIVVNEKLSVEKQYRRELRKLHYYIMKHGIFGHARFVEEKNPRALLEKIIGQVSHAIFVQQDDDFLLKVKDDLLNERLSAFGY